MISGSSTKSLPSLTCNIDDNTVITSTDGIILVISNILTGRVLKRTKIFQEPVIALDCLFPYVVAVSANGCVTTCRIMGEDFEFTDFYSSQYKDIPLILKLIPSADKPCLLLASRYFHRLDVLTVYHCTIFQKTFLQNSHMRDSVLEAVIVDKATLRYASALSYQSSVCIATGSLASLLETQAFVLSSKGASFAGAKLAWGRSCFKLWVSDNLGFIHSVHVADGDIQFRVGKVDTSRKFEDVCRDLEDQAFHGDASALRL